MIIHLERENDLRGDGAKWVYELDAFLEYVRPKSGRVIVSAIQAEHIR